MDRFPRGRGSRGKRKFQSFQRNEKRAPSNYAYSKRRWRAAEQKEEQSFPRLMHRDMERQPAQFVSNHFPLKIDESLAFNVYTVQFTPKIEGNKKKLRETVFRSVGREMRSLFSLHFFDNLVMYGKLHQESKEEKSGNLITLTANTRQNHQITLEKVERVELSAIPSQHRLQILHIILRSLMTSLGFKREGSTYLEANVIDEELMDYKSNKRWPIKLWPGFHISVHETQCGYTLLINPKFKILSHGTVLQIMNRAWDQSRDERDYEKNVCSELKTKTGWKRGVITLYNMRTYTCQRFDFEKNVDSVMDKKKNLTFRQYCVKNEYTKEALSDVSGLIKCDTRGKHNNDCYIIPQLAHFTGLSLRQSNDWAFVKALHNKTSPRPHERFEKACQLLAKLNQAFAKKNLKFKVSESAIRVRAQVLPGPNVITQKQFSKRNQYAKQKGGTWIAPEYSFVDTASPLMTGDAQAHSFTVIVVTADLRISKGLCDCLRAIARQKRFEGLIGLHERESIVPKTPFRGSKEQILKEWERSLRQVSKLESPVHGILAVLPHHFTEEVYAVINTLGRKTKDRELVTQCIRAKNADPTNRRMYNIVYNCVNSLLTKAGYIPWRINFTPKFIQEPTMIAGMDVCHDRRARESVVGFVSTYDEYFAKLHQQMSIQKMGQELVPSIDIFFRNALTHFNESNQRYPRHIIFYRDGVSAAQLQTVREVEIPKVRDVIKELNRRQKQKMQLIVIVSQKRIETRFFKHSQGRYEHAVPGSLFNKEIASKEYHDFYITSSKAPPGKTPIPTRYVVLEDDLKLSATVEGRRQLETVSYHLCSLYFDWPGSIRVPHVVKAADHIAFKFSDRTLKQKIRQMFPDLEVYDVNHFQQNSGEEDDWDSIFDSLMEPDSTVLDQ